MEEYSRVKTERNQVDKSEKEDVQSKKLIAAPCGKIYSYTYLFCWSMTTDHDKYVPNIINKQTSLNEQTKIVQEEVSPEVLKLNYAVRNKKRDQMQFSLEKGLEK